MSLFNSNTPATDGGNSNTATAEPQVRTIKPQYRVEETTEAYKVTVRLPGVAKDGVEVVAENDEVRVTARRSWAPPAGWNALHRESADAAYELVLTHDNAIDAEKISAELRDGILHVSLPKQEAVKPRKIAVA
jgi:HSP20 family molecular chaperone IbpA